MNKSAIDEDANSEVLNIFELEKSSRKIYYPNFPDSEFGNREYGNFEKQRIHKGIGRNP